MALTSRAPLRPLLLFGLAGCGLTGADATLAPRPSDGIGDFGPSAPIEVCLGAAKVSSPGAASSAGALCVEEGTAGKPCAADVACAEPERCVCGRCIVEACQGASSCGAGRICRQQRCTRACVADPDCAADERCVLGGCARQCQGDGACHFGERCDALQGVCAAKLCGGPVGCAPGDACEAEQVVGELHEPVILGSEGGDLAFVELRTGGASPSRSILRARVESAGRWRADPPAPVLSAEGGASAGAPSPIRRGGALELYFADGIAIRRARSTDEGRSFTVDPAPVLVPFEPWEQGFVGSPSAVDFQGRILLFYEGGPRAGVGLARLDGDVATRASDAPIVDPSMVEDPLTWRNVTEVGAPMAIVVDGALRLYFTARGAEGDDAIVADASVPVERNDSIGMAASADGVTFTLAPIGPVFARIANLRAHLGEREAAVRLLPGGAEIVFVAADATGDAVSGLGRAGP
ncbi:MAG: sialidase family protein [Byssovorax sp.]